MKLRRLWQTWEWPIVWAAGVLAFVLGLIGFVRLDRFVPQPVSWTESLYRTLKLFVLGMEDADWPLNTPLTIARFLAPAVIGYTAVKAFGVLFREQLQLLALRWKRGHVVICGLGRKGWN